MSSTISWLDEPEVKDFILGKVRKNFSNTNIANLVRVRFGKEVSEKSIRRAKRRWGVTNSNTGQKPTTKVNFERGTAEVVSKPVENVSDLNDTDSMIQERGLNPSEWNIDTVKVNEWEGPGGEGTVKLYHQMTLNLKRIPPLSEFVFPARSDGWKAPVKKQVRSKDKPQTFVITGDQQAPFHDPELHELFLEWLEYNKPDGGVLLGDTVDFPDISRHRYNPETTATVNECIQAGYDVLRGYVDASPNTLWRKIPGNHDERIRNTLIDWAVQLYGVRRATDGEDTGAEVLSVPHLLRLDELGIEYVDPKGQYDQAQIELSRYLAVRHGWLAKKGSGASALGSLEQLGYSIIIGHSHRQSIVSKTTHSIHGKPTTIIGVESGCMCRVDGLGYAVAPDWQQGFVTATIWPDGTFNVDRAVYLDGLLLYRDQRYN